MVWYPISVRNVFAIICIAFMGSACDSQPPKEPEAAATPAETAQARGAVEPTLAKSNFQGAIAAARKWQEDAILIQVTARGVGDDGKHRTWDYGFYSASAKKCALVNAVGAESLTQDAGDMCDTTEIKDFMDSDQAIKIARSNGVKQPQVTMAASMSKTPNGERVTWTVMDGGGVKPGDVILVFDANAGDILDKTVQR